MHNCREDLRMLRVILREALHHAEQFRERILGLSDPQLQHLSWQCRRWGTLSHVLQP